MTHRVRHGPGLSRTYLMPHEFPHVDARDKRGHDESKSTAVGMSIQAPCFAGRGCAWISRTRWTVCRIDITWGARGGHTANTWQRLHTGESASLDRYASS